MDNKNKFKYIEGDRNILLSTKRISDFYEKGGFPLLSNRLKNEIGNQRGHLVKMQDDENRICSSYAFRRLQRKAQMFFFEEGDYVHTRLTHTNEVATIGCIIANIIVSSEYKKRLTDINSQDAVNYTDFLSTSIKITTDQNSKRVLEEVESGDEDYQQYVSDHPFDNRINRENFIFSIKNSALIHDLGNPPCGHDAEVILNKYFEKEWPNLVYKNLENNLVKLMDTIPADKNEQMYCDFIKFNGNAFSLRLVTNLQPFRGRYGLDLCIGTLGAVIKYPNKSNSGKKFNYFYSENKIIQVLSEKQVFIENKVNPLAKILEAADDIANNLADIEDGIKKKAIKIEDVYSLVETSMNNFTDDSVVFEHLEKLLEDYKSNKESLRFIEELQYILKIYYIYEVANYYTDNSSSFLEGKETRPIMEIINLKPIFVELKNLVASKIHEGQDRLEKIKIAKKYITTILNVVLNKILKEESIFELNNNIYLGIISKNFFDKYIIDVNDIINDVNNVQKDKEIVYLKLRLVVDSIARMTDSFLQKSFEKIIHFDDISFSADSIDT
jgi:dGTPase